MWRCAAPLHGPRVGMSETCTRDFIVSAYRYIAITNLPIIPVFVEYLGQFLIDLNQIYRHSSLVCQKAHLLWISDTTHSTQLEVELSCVVEARGVQSDHDATQLNSTANCQSSSSSLLVMTSCMMQNNCEIREFVRLYQSVWPDRYGKLDRRIRI